MNEYTIGSGNRASLSTGAPSGEHAVGVVLYCRPFLLGGRGVERLQDICKRRLWKRVTLSIVAPWENLEEGLFTRDLEIQ